MAEPSARPVQFLSEAELARFQARLQRKDAIPLREFHDWWARRDPRALAKDPSWYARIAEATGQRDPFLSFDAAEEGLRADAERRAARPPEPALLSPRDRLRLLQLKALALARTGSSRAAQEALAQAQALDDGNAETLSLRARTYKDLWAASFEASPDEATIALREARSLYQRAFARSDPSTSFEDWIYAGINVAAMSLLLDERDEALRVARAVGGQCEARRTGRSAAIDYWTLATLAESWLIRGDLDRAREFYTSAAARAGGETLKLNSTRQQAARLLVKLGESPAALDPIFPTPHVVAFTGHRLDDPDRAVPRFRPEQEEAARALIRAELDRVCATVGYASAAHGGDLLFLEEMQARGAETNIQLPFPADVFLATSYPHADDALRERFHRVLTAATTVRVAGLSVDLGAPVVYAYANEVLLGRAKMKADVLRAPMHLLALWDGEPGLPGGTGSMAHWAAARGIPVTWLDPIRGRVHSPLPALPSASPLAEGEPVIRALLFADVVKYSELNDSDVRLFVEHYLGAAGRLLEKFRPVPLVQKTWGDAFCFAFEDVEAAGCLALALREEFDRLEQEPLGLSHSLRVRIGLHAGPVLPLHDPVTDKLDFSGTHVNRAARIEPITTERQIYASQEFAALATLRADSQLAFTYVGEHQLPKNFGVIALYLLRPRH